MNRWTAFQIVIIFVIGCGIYIAEYISQHVLPNRAVEPGVFIPVTVTLSVISVLMMCFYGLFLFEIRKQNKKNKSKNLFSSSKWEHMWLYVLVLGTIGFFFILAGFLSGSLVQLVEKWRILLYLMILYFNFLFFLFIFSLVKKHVTDGRATMKTANITLICAIVSIAGLLLMF